MNKEQLIKMWQNFADKQGDIMLNPNPKFIELLSTGVLDNDKKYGMKLCPCRIRDGTRETDLKMVCPCSFKKEKVWEGKGRCWCGLFVRKQ